MPLPHPVVFPIEAVQLFVDYARGVRSVESIELADTVLEIVHWIAHQVLGGTASLTSPGPLTPRECGDYLATCLSRGKDSVHAVVDMSSMPWKQILATLLVILQQLLA